MASGRLSTSLKLALLKKQKRKAIRLHSSTWYGDHGLKKDKQTNIQTKIPRIILTKLDDVAFFLGNTVHKEVTHKPVINTWSSVSITHLFRRKKIIRMNVCLEILKHYIRQEIY